MITKAYCILGDFYYNTINQINNIYAKQSYLIR